MNINNSKATVSIVNAAFTNNTNTSSTNAGGALRVQSANSLTISGVVFTGNSVPNGFGGAVSLGGASTIEYRRLRRQFRRQRRRYDYPYCR